MAWSDVGDPSPKHLVDEGDLADGEAGRVEVHGDAAIAANAQYIGDDLSLDLCGVSGIALEGELLVDTGGGSGGIGEVNGAVEEQGAAAAAGVGTRACILGGSGVSGGRDR